MGIVTAGTRYYTNNSVAIPTRGKTGVVDVIIND